MQDLTLDSAKQLRLRCRGQAWLQVAQVRKNQGISNKGGRTKVPSSLMGGKGGGDQGGNPYITLPSREGSQKQRLPLMEIPELRVLTQIATFSAREGEQKGELTCQPSA